MAMGRQVPPPPCPLQLPSARPPPHSAATGGSFSQLLPGQNSPPHPHPPRAHTPPGTSPKLPDNQRAIKSSKRPFISGLSELPALSMPLSSHLRKKPATKTTQVTSLTR